MRYSFIRQKSEFNKVFLSVLAFVLVLAFSLESSAQKQKYHTKQNRAFKNAERYFEASNFFVARGMFQEIYEKDTFNIGALFRISQCNHQLGEYYNSLSGFTKVAQFPKLITDGLYYQARANKLVGATDLALKNYTAYLADRLTYQDEFLYKQAIVERDGCLLARNENYRTRLNWNLVQQEAQLNTERNEFSAIYQQTNNPKRVLLASNRPESKGDSIDPSTGEKFSDFFLVEESGKQWKTMPLPPGFDKINSDYHEGGGCFNYNKTRFYFTRCLENVRCGIWVSVFNGAAWQEPVMLNEVVNRLGSSSKHPTLSAYGDTLFFASDREGSLGGFDIWMVTKESGEKWENPQPLADYINTPFHDLCPWYDTKEQVLYFSSDGWPGFGGLDIFASRLDKPGLTHLPEPINSSYYDGWFNYSANSAIFTTDRRHVYKDQIFTFELPDKAESFLKAFKNPTAVRLAQDKAKGLQRDMKPAEMILKPEELYTMSATDSLVKGRSKGAEEQLQARYLDAVYFEVNSATLNPESKILLRAIADELKAKPTSNLFLNGYTDQAGSYAFNLRLSLERVNACMNFLDSLGISKRRLTTEALGEKSLKGSEVSKSVPGTLSRCVELLTADNLSLPKFHYVVPMAEKSVSEFLLEHNATLTEFEKWNGKLISIIPFQVYRIPVKP